MANKEWPDWQDGGRTVELVLEDGRTVTGTLYVDDVFSAGEEVPIFIVETKDGTRISFADQNDWRFVG